MTTRQRLSRKEVAALPVRTYEEMLAGQLRMLKIPHIREYVIAPPRKFRADFLVTSGRPESPSHNTVLVEVDGGGYINGRHSRGAGMEADAEKSALAAINGYRVIHVTPKQVESGQAIAWIEAALKRREAA